MDRPRTGVAGAPDRQARRTRRSRAGGGADPVGPGAAAPGLLVLRYPGLSRPVVLKDAGAVLDGLSRSLSGWVPEVARPAAPPRRQPVSAVIRQGRGYHLSSPYLDAPMAGLPAASAVCGVIADLAQSFLEERPGCVALHCGAARIGGRLVAFTGAARAGKSTLIARLTAEPGMEIFCDDVLPLLGDGLAFGLGAAPRIRLPLPPRASPAFRAHVAAHLALSDDRYGYVRTANLAPHGSRAALRALVVLTRRDAGAAALHRLPPVEAVRHLLRQNLADPGEDFAAFTRLTRLAEELLCLRLVYSDLEEAVALVRRAFGAAAFPDPSVPLLPPLAEAEEPPAPGEPPEPADLSRRWRRADGVAVRRLGPEAVLWHARRQTSFALNRLGAAIWAVLEEPETGTEIAAALAEAYPGESPDRIRADLEALFAAMAAEALIEPLPG